MSTESKIRVGSSLDMMQDVMHISGLFSRITDKNLYDILRLSRANGEATLTLTRPHNWQSIWDTNDKTGFSVPELPPYFSLSEEMIKASTEYTRLQNKISANGFAVQKMEIRPHEVRITLRPTLIPEPIIE